MNKAACFERNEKSIDLSSEGVNEILEKALKRWSNIIKKLFFLQYSPLYILLFDDLTRLGVINAM